jgi:SAM-dependent methyltransferase
MPQLIAFDSNRPWLGGNILGGDPNTWCPELWDFLIDKFSPRSVCDVGCGEGYLINYFFSKGITVRGIDGLDSNRLTGPIPVRDKIITHDFIYPYPYASQEKYDMVISCEFVEHVHEQYCINYFDVFRSGRILAFTHAMPGQPGHNHVNCRDDRYWIEMMSILKFKYLEDISKKARGLSGTTLWNTVLIFKKA